VSSALVLEAVVPLPPSLPPPQPVSEKRRSTVIVLSVFGSIDFACVTTNRTPWQCSFCTFLNDQQKREIKLDVCHKK
jgi:hypothetical protein